jgi:hypothetical protein
MMVMMMVMRSTREELWLWYRNTIFPSEFQEHRISISKRYRDKDDDGSEDQILCHFTMICIMFMQRKSDQSRENMEQENMCDEHECRDREKSRGGLEFGREM